MFSWFKKKAQPPAEAPPAFPYFSTPENLSAEAALRLKRELEAQIQTISQLASPSLEQQQNLQAARQQLNQLLGYALETQPVPSSTATEEKDQDLACILLIEDDPGLSKLLRFLFEHHDYRVIQAVNGKEALQRICSEPPPDLVTLDLLMPYADGLEILQTLRQTPGWEQVPVIMLTSKQDEESVVRVLKAGADDFLSKPFQPEELLARAQRLLKRHPGSGT